VPTDNVLEFDPARPRRRRRSTASQSIGIPRGADLTLCLDSYVLSLKSANRTPKTIRSYTDTAQMLIAYLNGHDMPCDAERVQASHVQAFIVREIERTSPASADVCWRNLHAWFNWMLNDEIAERTTSNPVRKTDRPNVPKKAKKYLTLEEQAQLLRTARSNSFEDRRDTALMRILGDSGPRATGLTNIRYTPRNETTHDVDLRNQRIRIRLKGGDERWISLGAKSTAALDRYIRARSAHKDAASPWLWLGIAGHNTQHFTSEGLRDMLRRRGEEAGIPGVHPHRYRGSAAHELLKAGAGKEVVQRVLGWKTAEMVDLYTDALADERAMEIHRQMSPGDRI
jgi:site-specific recombinase XerD